MEHARRDDLEPYVTRDGSTIEHLHRRAEELYLVTAGSGVLQVGGEERAVPAGERVAIGPGTVAPLAEWR